jgi:fructokinase
MNHEELPQLASMLGTGGTRPEEQAARLREAFGLRFLCVTRGASGSLLLTAQGADAHPGYQVRVADTVGAGDAFTAGLTCAWLRGESLPRVNAFANRVGAWVASQTGAMPLRPFAEEMREAGYNQYS